jgi:sirohydrochlorin cobaltochelatase
VPIEAFADAALVLVGHGSTLNAESSAPTYQHADELRRRGIFAQVLEAFWKLEPGLAGVLRGVFAPRVFIVPVFISEGYFTEEVVPRELGFCAPGQKGFSRVQRRGAQTLYYCGPVGTHDSMTRVLLDRAREIVEAHPFPRAPKPGETTLFIAGHGTGNNENSRKAIERQVELIRALNEYAAVHAVFMEEEPRISDCYRLAPTKNIVMVPFFISDGLHSREDIPVMLGSPREMSRAEALRSGAGRLISRGSPREILRSPTRQAEDRRPISRGSPREILRSPTRQAEDRRPISRGSPREILRSPTRQAEDRRPISRGESDQVVQERIRSGQPTWRNPTEKQGKRLWYSASIGTDPLVADVILERVREAAAADR